MNHDSSLNEFVKHGNFINLNGDNYQCAERESSGFDSPFIAIQSADVSSF
jgi:hypothetical protein